LVDDDPEPEVDVLAVTIDNKDKLTKVQAEDIVSWLSLITRLKITKIIATVITTVYNYNIIHTMYTNLYYTCYYYGLKMSF